MVQGLNWNNYSNNQILEMKKSGMQVPDDVYKKAQEAVSKEVQTESLDTQNVTYQVEDFSAEINEAKELREQLEAEGESLSSMVKTFTEKSNQATDTLSTLFGEVENNISYITQNEEMSQTLASTAEDEQAVVRELVDETQKKVEEKQNELEQISAKIEDGTATEDEQNQAKSLSDEIAEIADEGNANIASKQAIANEATSKAVAINSNLKDVAQTVGKAVNKANDGLEIATETQDLGKKLYDKGAKIQKIAMAIGGVLGGIAGAGVGYAVSNKVNSNRSEDFVNGLANGYKDVVVTDSSYGGVVYAKNDFGVSYNNDWVNDQIGSTATTAMGIAGGAVAGAGIGVGLGSLFGKGKMETGKKGMEAAAKLTSVANDTKTTAEKVAQQNNLVINTHQATEVSVNELDATVKDGQESTENTSKEIASLSEEIDSFEIPSEQNEADDKDLKEKKKV